MVHKFQAVDDLLPEGEYEGTVKKCHKDTLSDGSEVLFVEWEFNDQEGKSHIVHDVIKDQERLDQFLLSIGYPAGSMKLKTKE